jgi:hypothetical protein
MSVKGARRRHDQSKRDREAEQDRREWHLHDEAALSADLLFGAVEIARYIGRKPRWVYHQQKNLGLSHVGATLIGSKTKLTKLLTN